MEPLIFSTGCPDILLPFGRLWSLLEPQQKEETRDDPLERLDWESDAGESSRCADRSFFFFYEQQRSATKERRCPGFVVTAGVVVASLDLLFFLLSLSLSVSFSPSAAALLSVPLPLRRTQLTAKQT